MGRKLGRMGRKLDLGIFKLLIRMGRTLLRKGTYRQTVTQRKGKESLISGFPKFRNRELRGLCLLSIFSEQHRAGTVYHPSCRGKPQSPSIKQWGGGTWIYLGNFKFTAHEQAHERIVLTNQSNKSGKDYHGRRNQDRWRHGEHRT